MRALSKYMSSLLEGFQMMKSVGSAIHIQGDTEKNVTGTKI